MKVWLGGNIDKSIYDEYRVIRNELEKRINLLFEKINYDSEIKSLDITFIIRDDINDNSFKYSKRTKESDIEFNILLKDFLILSKLEKVNFLVKSIIYSLNMIIEKYHLNVPLLEVELKKEFNL